MTSRVQATGDNHQIEVSGRVPETWPAVGQKGSRAHSDNSEFPSRFVANNVVAKNLMQDIADETRPPRISPIRSVVSACARTSEQDILGHTLIWATPSDVMPPRDRTGSSKRYWLRIGRVPLLFGSTRDANSGHKGSVNRCITDQHYGVFI